MPPICNIKLAADKHDENVKPDAAILNIISAMILY